MSPILSLTPEQKNLGNTSVNKIDKSECKKSMKAQQKVYWNAQKLVRKRTTMIVMSVAENVTDTADTFVL